MASIDSGLPLLQAEAAREGDGAIRALGRQVMESIGLILATPSNAF